MAYDKVIDSAKLDSAMVATANAIREKTGSTEMIPWDESTGFASAVEGINTGDSAVLDQIIDGSATEITNITAYQLGEYCFCYKRKIAKVECSESVRYIRNHAFYDCDALKTLILRRNAVVVLSATNAFTGSGMVNSEFEETGEYVSALYVPQAVLSEYEADTNWAQIAAKGCIFTPIEGSEYE